MIRSSNRLGIGTATFVPAYGLDASSVASGSELLATAIERGIAYIDTAAAYGNSERVIGDLAALLRQHRVRVCTKIALRDMSDGTIGLDSALAASLGRLRSRSVDTLLLHSAGIDDLKARGVGESLTAVKTRGQAERTGASTYGITDACWALEQPWCDVLQVEHSILNQSVLRAISPGRKRDQEIVVRSVLCKGLLTERRNSAAQELAAPILPVIHDLECLARDWSYSLPELAMRFALDTPGVDVALVGVANLEELAVAILAARREPLKSDQMAILVDFDRSALDCVHPERWNQLRTPA